MPTDVDERSRPKCRSCGASLLWVIMRGTGRANPLNPEPSPNGNIVLTDRVATNGSPIATAAAAPNSDQVRYVSHFATCPKAKSFRKRYNR
jgi:hypothetical protein